MILEAQFGETVTPIERPRLNTQAAPNGSATEPAAAEQEEEEEPLSEDERAEAEATELARLHALGIPFPGVEIKVDAHIARVYLEDLEVECANAVLRDRIRVVLERAVETVASMWTEEVRSRSHNNAHANGIAYDQDKLMEKKLAMIEA